MANEREKHDSSFHPNGEVHVSKSEQEQSKTSASSRLEDGSGTGVRGSSNADNREKKIQASNKECSKISRSSRFEVKPVVPIKCRGPQEFAKDSSINSEAEVDKHVKRAAEILMSMSRDSKGVNLTTVAKGGSYVCEICTKTCTTPQALGSHVASHKRGRVRDYVCQVCRRHFGSLQALGGHARVHKQREGTSEGSQKKRKHN